MSRLAIGIAAAFACTASALSLGACGMVTGLSDDYTFTDDASADGGGASADSAADAAATTDAAPDATANSCNPNQANALANELASLDASQQCKSCLQSTCCQPTLACLSGIGSNDCKNRLECEIKCTSKPDPADRAACIQGCADNSGMTPAFNRVLNCGCTSCGLQ